jgi:hypothetical protein
MGPRLTLIAALWLTASASAETGTIAGTVRVVGTTGQPLRSAPVLVFVEDVTRAFPPPQPLEIRQRGRQFHPRLLLVPVGASVAFPNDDVVDHNVFSLSPIASFDLGYFGTGAARRTSFEKPGAVRIYCNIHPQMIADVLVLANPHYAQVGEDGKFAIPQVPTGRRTLRAWFPHGPSVAKVVEVRASGAEAAFELQATVTTTTHENKHGEPYFLDYQK